MDHLEGTVASAPLYSIKVLINFQNAGAVKKTVKIFGVGSLRERELVTEIQSVARQLKLEVEVEQVNDIDLFLQRSLPAIPALLVEDRVVANGRLPAREELIRWLAS